MANLFSKIASLLNEKPSDSIMDDNAAVSAVDNNPYMSSVVLGARNAYDTLHTLMNPLIKGKKSSLKQIDKWLKDWTERLQKIVDMYEELGVDRLATWTYRGGYGTSVAAKDPIELWDNIGRNYKRVLQK